MLKLAIVDDERIIRESIKNLIDWASLDIEVVALYRNGIEAYNMILDQCPDIVMTDIQMPGFSGLELIKRLTQTDNSIEFIILSGYQEFSYAKEAMQYGVKHYLLKPCNENQIIESIKTAKKDLFYKRLKLNSSDQLMPMRYHIKSNMIRSLIVDGALGHKSLDDLIEQYAIFNDFDHNSYELCYLYYVDQKEVSMWIKLLYSYFNKEKTSDVVYPIYCKNVLVFLFESYDVTHEDFDEYMHNSIGLQDNSLIAYKRVHFNSLRSLLTELFRQLKRFEYIDIYNDNLSISSNNYQSIVDKIDDYYTKICDAKPTDRKTHIDGLIAFLGTIQTVNNLQVLIINLLLKAVHDSENQSSHFLFSDLMLKISNCDDRNEILRLINEILNNIFIKKQTSDKKYSDFIEEIIEYINKNISNQHLSLKYIAENFLFMNVDYVGKQFLKQTGKKFSAYLTEIRINKAKELLKDSSVNKVYVVAEKVGCGNNPQYFSQIFKKHTNMTPSEYIQYVNKLSRDI